MRENTLRLLGLMRRANALAFGELNTGAAARAGKAALLLLASDASENARKRAQGFAAARQLPLTVLPFTKAEFASAVGLGGGSMAAVTDAGFAGALLRALAGDDPETYGEAAARFQAPERRAGRPRKNSAGR